MPNTRMPAISSAVAIGRRMKISEMFIAAQPACWLVAAGAPSVSILHLDVVGQPVLAVDHHLLAGGEPLGDHRNPVLPAGHL